MDEIEQLLAVMRDARLEDNTPAVMQLSAQLAELLSVSEVGWDDCGLWCRFEVADASQRMRYLWPGRFQMGSPETEAGRVDREGPVHEVVLTRGYWLGEVPVVQALWEAVMGDNPSQFRGADRPVERIDWHDCQLFCEKLASLVPRLHLRLPTEAEWEYAARAGTNTTTYGGDIDIQCARDPRLHDIAWYIDNSDHQTHPVGQKRANVWGLHDMLGNVVEWCQDAFMRYSAQERIDPCTFGTARVRRITRGGSWLYHTRLMRVAYRGHSDPGRREDDLGLRLAGGAARGEAP